MNSFFTTLYFPSLGFMANDSSSYFANDSNDSSLYSISKSISLHAWSVCHTSLPHIADSRPPLDKITIPEIKIPEQAFFNTDTFDIPYYFDLSDHDSLPIADSVKQPLQSIIGSKPLMMIHCLDMTNLLIHLLSDYER